MDWAAGGITVTILRLANMIRPAMDTALSRAGGPVVPTVFGRDARLQLLRAGRPQRPGRATLAARPGTFNIGARGVIMMSQAIRRSGRVSPAAAPGGCAGAGLDAGRAGRDASNDTSTT